MKVFVIAGEASGDKLGAAMMQGLKTLQPDVHFEGVGGPRMIAEGLESLFAMDEISIMGIAEILREYRALKARIAQTAAAVIAAKPDVLVTIDLPEFTLRVAKLVKQSSDIRVVHYVAPTVWAWRPGRAAKMAPHVDQVLALLPFEPPFMQEAGMRCDFVGHPVVAEPQADAQAQAAFLERHGIDGDCALVLPGSRRSEVSRLLPIFGEVAARLAVDQPKTRLVVPAAPAVLDPVRAAVSGWPGQPVLIDTGTKQGAQDKLAAFGAARAALAASGTVSLELAAAGTPMVIAYDMSWLSRQIIGRMLRVDTVTLVNLVTDTRAVPEFIGARCKPDDIARAMTEVLENPQAQMPALQQTMQHLGQGGEPPGLRAARAVLDGLTAP